VADAPPASGSETSAADFFFLGEPPELSLGGTLRSDIEAAFAFERGARAVMLFD